MKIIGLCGHSGSGKGYVCQKFQSFDIPSIDTDRVYSDIILAENGDISPCVAELKESFGDSVVNPDLTLNRKALSEIVFSGDSSRLELLNKITHKYILSKTYEILEDYKKEGTRAVIIDAPVLFESGFDKLCDVTAFVSAPIELSVKRIVERDMISEDAARKRLSHQMSDDERRELCSFEFVNDDISEIKPQIVAFINRFLYED